MNKMSNLAATKLYLMSLLMENFWAKSLISITAFLLPLHTLFVFVFLIILLDLLTGCWKSLKNGVHIQSSGLFRTIQKVVAYLLLMVMIALFEKYVFGLSTLFITTYSMGMVLLTEAYSIIENVAEITNNKAILGLKSIVSGFKKNNNTTDGRI